MQLLSLQTEPGSGPETEVRVLFDGPRRKIIQITLRNDAVLKAHKAEEPITVQFVSGSGNFVEIETATEIELKPGTLLTVEPAMLHEVRATPEVSILLTKFKGD